MKKLTLLFIISILIIGCDVPGRIQADIKVYYTKCDIDTIKIDVHSLDLPRLNPFSLEEDGCLHFDPNYKLSNESILACNVRRFEVLNIIKTPD